MTLRVNVKSKLSCPKHPRYDPAMEGESAIKAGCLACHLLLAVHRAAMSLVENISKTQEDLKALRAKA